MDEIVRKRNNAIKQYTDHVEVITEYLRTRKVVVRKLDVTTGEHITAEMKKILFHLHPTATIKNMYKVPNCSIPQYKVVSNVISTHYIDITATVGPDGITTIHIRVLT
jgi:hypothetical protein